METPSTRPRRPWLAAVLSVFGGGPLGQIYVGRLRRGLLIWLVNVLLVLVFVFCMITLPIGHFGLAAICLGVVAFYIGVVVDAFLLARRHRHAASKRYQRWWVYGLFVVVFCLGNHAIAYFNRSFIGEAFIIPTRGMSPTIQPGDRILVDRLCFDRKHFCRNDVVVFRSEGSGSPMFTQRVVGLPGDLVEIKDERVFINGKKCDDPHAMFDDTLPRYDELVNHGPVTVPSDCVFLLGDNRRLSKDSRSLGPIPLSDIHGVARLIYWSRKRTFPNPNDTSHYVPGPIQWSRMGLRLD